MSYYLDMVAMPACNKDEMMTYVENILNDDESYVDIADTPKESTR